MMRLRVVVVAHRLVEVDHAAHEFRLEYADRAEIEQVHRAIRPHLVIAEMRVAVDHAVAVERHVPGAEQRAGDGVALLLRRVLLKPMHQRTAVEPGHRQQARGAVALDRHRDVHAGIVPQHDRVEPHLRRLALVVQLLAQALGQLLVDLLVLDRVVHPVIDRHREAKLAQIGFHVLAMSGYCSLQATSVPSGRRARCTWPRLAAAAACSPKLANFDCQSGPARSPSGGARRPSPSPARSPATAPAPPHIPPAARPARSRGTAPLSSAAPSGRREWSRRSSAWLARSVLIPNTRCPATRAAIPPTAPEVRAKRRNSPNRGRGHLVGHGMLSSRGLRSRRLQLIDEARRSRPDRVSRRPDRTHRGRMAPAIPCGAWSRRLAACRDISR